MTPPALPHPDWRGQWLSVHDLAAIIGKSYFNVYHLIQQDTQGLSILRCGGRIWVRIDPSIYDALVS